MKSDGRGGRRPGSGRRPLGRRHAVVFRVDEVLAARLRTCENVTELINRLLKAHFNM